MNHPTGLHGPVRSCSLANRTIAYIDQGGPVVVLVHGLMGSLHDWDPQIAELSTDFRIIAVDLPGHGQSDKAAGDYSLSAHAATIRDLLVVLGVDSATMVGHSFGEGCRCRCSTSSRTRWTELL